MHGAIYIIMWYINIWRTKIQWNFRERSLCFLSPNLLFAPFPHIPHNMFPSPNQKWSAFSLPSNKSQIFWSMDNTSLRDISCSRYTLRIAFHIKVTYIIDRRVSSLLFWKPILIVQCRNIHKLIFVFFHILQVLLMWGDRIRVWKWCGSNFHNITDGWASRSAKTIFKYSKIPVWSKFCVANRHAREFCRFMQLLTYSVDRCPTVFAKKPSFISLFKSHSCFRRKNLTTGPASILSQWSGNKSSLFRWRCKQISFFASNSWSHTFFTHAPSISWVRF